MTCRGRNRTFRRQVTCLGRWEAALGFWAWVRSCGPTRSGTRQGCAGGWFTSLVYRRGSLRPGELMTRKHSKG